MAEGLRRVRAVRYAMPLREGGSLPAIVEGDDLGLYVLKFRGAGQGPLALVAEVVGGELGRALGLSVPGLVLPEADAALGRHEPAPEIRDLLKRSAGWNAGMDFLPGARMFDPAAGDAAGAEEASLMVWFDAWLSNVDRTARNPNLLLWHGGLRPIDHGAALYWQHNWETRERAVAAAFPSSRQHVLLPWASLIAEAAELARERLTREAIERVLAEVPAEWLLPEGNVEAQEARRREYATFLVRRLERSRVFVEEAQRGRAELV